LHASVKSSVSRPHNPAGGNGRLKKIVSAVPRRLYADFCNKIGTFETWKAVKRSAYWGAAEVPARGQNDAIDFGRQPFRDTRSLHQRGLGAARSMPSRVQNRPREDRR
jgi:hypothetical protein